MTTNNPPGEVYFVGVPEFGRRFGVSRTSAWELVWRGVVKTTWIGGRRLVPIAECERYAAELMANAS